MNWIGVRLVARRLARMQFQQKNLSEIRMMQGDSGDGDKWY